MKLPAPIIHRKGETLLEVSYAKARVELDAKVAIDTFGGRVHVEWEPHAAVTPLGQLAFFIEYLRLGNLFEPWVEECPLDYTSPNAPDKRDVLGTILLSVLSGHTRYAHMTTIQSDAINPGLLGMKRIASEDSVRRALLKIGEESGTAWMQKHLYNSYGGLLSTPWILDVDSTVKLLYGKQEGAVVGYNPKKPGRPSHMYHVYWLANLRLALEVDVHAGNESAASHALPGLLSLLSRLPHHHWPTCVRGDSSFGTEPVMVELEKLNLPYLFKLKQTANVKKLVKQHMQQQRGWTDCGQGWQGAESTLQLIGWTRARRVVILRKAIKQEMGAVMSEAGGQLRFCFGDGHDKARFYEYAVLVTSLSNEILSLAQLYRDRGDCENGFDEMKNQWGWAGYTTQDLKRCRLMAQIIALIYNWWSLYVRLAEPDKHYEAITSRPLLLEAVGTRVSHSGQTFISISSTHGELEKVRGLLGRLVEFFKTLKNTAEQLTPVQRWYRILSKAVEKYLRGRQLEPPILLA